MGVHQVSGAKLRRMFKAMAKCKKIRSTYEYANSLNQNTHRMRVGKIESYTVTAEGYPGKNGVIHAPDCYKVEFTIDGITHHEFIPGDAHFLKFGVVQWSNSGPWCYFTIRILDK